MNSTGLDNKVIITAEDNQKYKAASEVAERALKAVMEACVVGVKVIDLCTLGDKSIVEGCKTIFSKGKNKTLKRGIAFPTTVSPNHVICHLSPLSHDSQGQVQLKEGDLIKIEMGAHIDGFIGQIAHSFVLGASPEKPITGRKADVMQAAYLAAEAAVRTLKPGNTNWQVTEVVQKVAEAFDCKPVEGMLSHQVAKDVIDGEKTIILNPTEAQKQDFETFTFEVGEAYGLDILISTGEAKSRDMDVKTTIFKRNQDQLYQLKMKASRALVNEVSTKFGFMAFNLRNCEDETKAKLGIVECTRHGVLIPYPVLTEKEGDFVAHVMFTVLLMPNGVVRLSKLPWNQDLVKSEKSINDDTINSLLASEYGPVKKNVDKKST